MRHVMIWTFRFSFAQNEIFGHLAERKNLPAFSGKLPEKYNNLVWIKMKCLIWNRERNYSFDKSMFRSLNSQVSYRNIRLIDLS